MSPAALHAVSLWQEATARLRVMTILCGVIVTSASATLLQTVPSFPVRLALFAFLAGYVARKIQQLLHQTRTLRQLRLEGQFLRHSLNTKLLDACMHTHRHLWEHSAIWQGLRAAQKHPISSSPQHHLTTTFAKALRAYLPHAKWIDFVLLFFLLLTWLAGAATLHFPLFILLGTLPLLTTLAVEVTSSMQVIEMGDGFPRFVEMLALWTSEQHFLERAQAQQPYHHTVLYRSAIPPLHRAALTNSL